jgi:EAL and modified HD-GYP domain-containing signal transduction protein
VSIAMLLPPPPPVKVGRLLLAREPILDRRSRLVGYRIHVGQEPGETAPVLDDVRAIADGVDPQAFEFLRQGHRAFVAVSRQSLVAGVPRDLRADHMVLDVPASLSVDKELEAACRAARERGFRIALSDFDINARAAGLVPHADFLKVNVAEPSKGDARARLVACFKSDRISLIATGVHTFEQMHAAAADGFTSFQGHFLGRPLLLPSSKRPLAVQHANLMRLLRTLNDPNLSTGQLEEIIKHDPAVCYRILRAVNSAAYGVQATITSISEALLLLGRDVVRRWASLWIVAGLGTEAHSELVVMSAVRARTCETIATVARGARAGDEAFLLGMCSLLDVLLGRPMSVVAAELPLEEATRQALCGEAGVARDTLDCVIAHERGDWAQSAALAARAGLKPESVQPAFLEALRWSREFQSETPA